MIKPFAPSRSRSSRRRMSSWALLMLLGVVLWFFGTDQRRPDLTQADAGWGQESAQAQEPTALSWLPMAAANACGLGASSCFKCHNGKRAGAPNTEAKSPWHVEHAKVNNSCTGCHKGNPRVMKDDVAHAKMEAKPRNDSAGACVGCHSSDLAKVKDAYAKGGK